MPPASPMIRSNSQLFPVWHEANVICWQHSVDIRKRKNDVYVKVMFAVRTAKLSSPMRIFSLAWSEVQVLLVNRWVSSMQPSRDQVSSYLEMLPPPCTSSLSASSQRESLELELTDLTSAHVLLAGPSHVTILDYKGSWACSPKLGTHFLGWAPHSRRGTMRHPCALWSIWLLLLLAF